MQIFSFSEGDVSENIQKLNAVKLSLDAAAICS